MLPQKYLNSIIIGIRLVIVIVFLMAGFSGVAGVPAVQALENLDNCTGNVCVRMTTDLAPGSTGVDANILVHTNTYVQDVKTSNFPACNGSRQLYNVIRHGINGSPDDYDYINSGSGGALDYSFKTLTEGTRHRYTMIFYCWTQQISDKASLETLFSTLSREGQMWSSQVISYTTRKAPAPPVTPKTTTPPVTTADPTAGSTNKTAAPSDQLYNPLPSGDLTNTFLIMAQGLLGIVAIWAVIYVIVGGFQMVMSQGNEEAYTTAKKTVTWAILGVVIALLSFSVIAIVQNLLKVNIENPKF